MSAVCMHIEKLFLLYQSLKLEEVSADILAIFMNTFSTDCHHVH